MDTKCRYAVLVGDAGQRVRELLIEIARSMEQTIYAESINRNHVHLQMGIPPHILVSKAAKYQKGKSSLKMLSEFSSQKKRYCGQNLWGRGYWASSSGNVTDEAWKKYIEDQKPEPDDNFRVVQVGTSRHKCRLEP